MANLVTTIFSATVSDDYTPQLLDDFLAVFVTSPALSAYAGEQIEPGPDGKKVIWVAAHWPSAAAHREFIASPAHEPILAPFIKLARLETAKEGHYAFSEKSVAALDAPVTEVLQAKLKAPENKAKFEALLTGISTALPIATAAPADEDSELYTALVGWDSVEAHHKTIAEIKAKAKADGKEEAEGPAAQIAALTTPVLVHVAFKEYKKLSV